MYKQHTVLGEKHNCLKLLRVTFLKFLQAFSRTRSYNRGGVSLSKPEQAPHQ